MILNLSNLILLLIIFGLSIFLAASNILHNEKKYFIEGIILLLVVFSCAAAVLGVFNFALSL